MKLHLTSLLLLLTTGLCAQRVKFSSRETHYPDAADFDIIGRVNEQNLIYLEGANKAEIGIYDDDMKKVRSVPANFLKTRSVHSDFFAYPDHYQVFLQYIIDSTFYISTLRGDGNGGVGAVTVLDSLGFSVKVTMIMGSKSSTKPDIILPPMFMVLRSENRQWFMILKNGKSGNVGEQFETTLYDKDLHPVEHSRFTYSQDTYPGEFSEFILDNDGDLAFTFSSVENGDLHRIVNTNLIFKPHGRDTIISQELSAPDVILDKLLIRVDNANHRYILNSFFYDWGKANLSGLCSMVWDKKSLSQTSTERTSPSTGILSAAGSNTIPPDQVLNQFYLRQVIPLADGAFMVLAERCYEAEQIDINQKAVHRYDFIRGKYSLYTPMALSIDNANQKLPGYWRSTGWDRIGGLISTGSGRYTDNLLLFFMDHDGKVQTTKVINKTENSTVGMEILSFQSFNDGKVTRLMYNENIKGHWLPIGTSINIDGSLGQDPILPGLDRDQVLFPRFGEQVGPRTIIIPGQDRGHLCFAKVDL